MMRQRERVMFKPSAVARGKAGTGLSRNPKSAAHRSITSVETLLDLQRTRGNAFVQRLIQRKLAVSRPGDSYEHEADRVADAVVGKNDTSNSIPAISRYAERGVHRICTECEEEMQRQAVAGNEEQEELRAMRQPEKEEEEKLERQVAPEDEEAELQAKAEPGGERSTSGETEDAVRALRGGGQPLPEPVRAYIQPRMGYDFSGVRIHTGGHAAQLARSVNALAFTVGRDIVFGAGQYRPETSAGKRLLAHELTHVVQQTGAARAGGVHRTAASLARGSQRPHVDRFKSQAGPLLQRACAGGSWRFEYDGCSLPGVVTSTLGIADKDNPAGGADTRFGTPGRYGGRPCDNHDRCYQTCGSSRAVCDARMLGEMLSVCRRSAASASVKSDCFKWANVYYAGLVAGGGPAHLERQAQVCGCTVRGWLGI